LQLEEVIVPAAQGERGTSSPRRGLWELTVTSNDAELGMIIKELREATGQH
jgi:hypothetical protein